MKVLVTGFDPFGGAAVNPSYEAVRLLPDRIGGIVIEKRELPTVFGESGELLLRAIGETRPSFVICVGQAAGRRGITLEKYALNVRAARIPDNRGFRPAEEKIDPVGPDALSVPFSVSALAERLNAAYPVFSPSYHAGTFVCNELYYRLLSALPRCGVRAGLFVHVPCLPEQAENGRFPSMTLTDIRDALLLLIRTLTDMNENDLTE